MLGDRLRGHVAHAAAICAVAAFAAAPCSAQQGVVVGGVVVSSATGQSLPFATVSVANGIERFTSEDGSFSLSLDPGEHRLRIKQLGYSPLDTLIAVRRGVDLHALTFVLKPVAFTLSTIRTFASSCAAGENTGEISGILAELEKNAEREKLLRNDYPFLYDLERRTEVASRSGTMSVKTDTVRFVSTVNGTYRPGQLVRLVDSTAPNGLREMRIPELIDLADPAFLANHCFRYAGIERVDSAPAYRIDFKPSSDLNGPDVEGSAFIDSSSYMIRESIFRLTKPDKLRPPIIGIEVTTLYHQIFNGVALFGQINSAQPLTRNEMLHTTQTQNQRLIAVRFYGRTPEGIELTESPTTTAPATTPATAPTPTPATPSQAFNVATTPASDSTGILVGTVVDSAGHPLRGAEIRTTEGTARVASGDSGQFILRGLKPGRTNFVVHMLGYGPANFSAELASGRPHRVRIVLSSSVVQLKAVVVNESGDPILAETGYYQRKKTGWGTFITPEEVARRNPDRATDMLRMVMGVDIRSSGRVGTLPYSTRSLSISGRCLMGVFIDGHQVSVGGGMTMEQVISGSEVGAMEVYPDAGQTPPEFLSLANSCGVIVIWTKGMLAAPTPADTTKHW